MQYRIQSVRLKNFKCFDGSKYYEFILDDTKNPIILTGPNGFGKTTFFDAIELIFSNKITRFNESIEKGNIDLQKNVLLNEANSDGFIVCTLINENREHMSLFARINHRMHKVNYSDSITYGMINDSIVTKNLDRYISEYSDWRKSISEFDVLKYSKENFAVYYYISQAESVHFLKQSITQRKDALNALLDLGDVENWVKFLQDELIGKTVSSSNVIINEEIKSLDAKINEDIIQLKSLGVTTKSGYEFEFFNIINLGKMDNVPLWDSEKLEEVDTFELERGIRDIDRISYLMKDYEDYKNHLWNKKLESAMISGVEDFLLSCEYVKNKKIDIDSIKHTIELKKRVVEIFNNSVFLRRTEIVPSDYSADGMRKLKKLFPEGVLFDIEAVQRMCIKLIEMNKNLSSKQEVIKKLESARLALYEANEKFDENAEKCPYCGQQYGESIKLKEAYEAAHDLLEKENGEELKKYNELLKQLKKAVKESKQALNKEIGPLNDSNVTAILDEIDRLSTFISDKKRVENVEILIPLITVDKAFENMRKQEQKNEFQRMVIEAKKPFSSESFPNNLSSYAYDSLIEEYPGIEWTKQNLLKDEKMIDKKKGYIKAAINSKKNKKANEIKARIKENIRRWQALKVLREDLKNIHKVYTNAIESYKNQILNRLRVPLLIYTGKILQDYQNGLGVFISKDEMRFVTNGDVKHDILNTFSSGQLSGFVLAFLFSMNKQYVKESEDNIGFILIDDPVQTMDDINISSMIEVLRNDFKDRQIILSTHETDKENYILYKFFKYNRIGQSFNVKDRLYGI
ncbi:AAA family ATPase [Enterococcus cecorum]|uniref:AAA family ATPase n=1 Tax=Enterococcus cecorum TaxID=44008 RepID=A0AAW8TMT1_9ENTE|nr:AAA family ATPase [Enterococcus cecorum]MDT2796520.1 AAA family ATPase [Enterococcus cecorum]CAI3394134.1 AAA family ATPase [Enterococcus cecorum]CAI3408895.1 AAA family ATPase [Enterococcus cecorum]CAI3511535.1 AAA family ATPase [Enterococcus cecorum]CAI3512267.1 AAA family ATPase [Enterococcus cecorum]